ncbi:hypothetical protein [Natronococcus jeotgali]|uniref:Uncharacterized protein n=1 Tax=Natronococcus jeotgali DSM 18795 TaxID=1227498 RepID=L9X3H7_9EURY|nr:hypothetical protein [Natronococcus jeotgali]ELY55133.1 hypothetical protein C492_15806 [Natronococcus jeotgali DSM 18795]
MAEKDTNRGTMKRRGYLSGLAASGAGIGALSVATSRSRAGSKNDEKEKGGHGKDDDETKDSHELDGDDLFLVFGADASEKDLGGWVDDHYDEITGEQDSFGSVIQYQDVDQLNVTQQGNAISIAIDGGEATAIQEAEQDNVNTQAGSATSLNVEEKTRDETFDGPKRAYIVFAEETGCRTFSGWVAREDTYENDQSATATIEQEQTVDQFNYSSQSASVAVAEDGSCAQAYQRSWQSNENYQHAAAAAANIGEADDQDAEASVEQAQEVSQLNVSEQGVAIAIAVGECSNAEAYQVSAQLNLNEQVAEATAINFDVESVDDILERAEMSGELPKDAVKRSDDGGKQSNGQDASAEISQVQRVGQENISLQNAAIALGVEESYATARQVSYQGNFNAQVATAEGLNVEGGHCSAHSVLTGSDARGDDSWALAYENGDTDEQTAAAQIEQLQFVEQLNVNEQYTAIAFAADCGKATAEQLSYQANQNVQLAEARAVNEADGEESEDEKKGKKHGKDGKKKGKKHGDGKKKGGKDGKKKKGKKKGKKRKKKKN